MSGGLGIVKLLATECLRRFITQQHTSELALLRFHTDPSNRQPFPIKYAIIHTGVYKIFLFLTTEVRMLRGHKDRKFLCTSFRVE